MIKLKDILSELLIAEALPPSVAKKYTSIKRNRKIQTRLDSIFNALAKMDGASTSKRGDRVYLPLTSSGKTVGHESPIKKDVESVLQGTDFKLKDYKTGVVIDKFGRETRLGKVLAKLGKKDVLDKFVKDKTRDLATKTDFTLVFSKHPYDIAGMSTDRGWTSCMDLYSGGNRKYVNHDIKQGSFICYVTDPNDTNLNSPKGRLLAKPLVNITDKNDVLYVPEDKIYGTAPNNFFTTVNTILSDIQGEKVGQFKLVSSLYCDSFNSIIRHEKIVKDVLDGKTEATTKSVVEKVLTALDIRSYTINADLTVDVRGNVNISQKHLTKLPVKFGKVSGTFDCESNKLTSLQGAPQKVGRHFKCGSNQLTSLQGVPQEVRGDFLCDANEITSLQGAPQKVGGRFACDDNQLTSLQGAPKEVGGGFSCSGNKKLPKSEKEWAKKNIKAKSFRF
jgi:hypothetical protein